MRALSRCVGILGTTVGLVVVLAPAAGATGQSPLVQRFTGPTSVSITSPCDDTTVSTTGTGVITTITAGEHTVVSFLDKEQGQGYVFVQEFTDAYGSLSSSYSGEGYGLWLNPDRALDFHGTIPSTVYVNTANNAPDSEAATYPTLTCGL